MGQIIDPIFGAHINGRQYAALKASRRNAGNTDYEFATPGWLDLANVWVDANTFNVNSQTADQWFTLQGPAPWGVRFRASINASRASLESSGGLLIATTNAGITFYDNTNAYMMLLDYLGPQLLFGATQSYRLGNPVDVAYGRSAAGVAEISTGTPGTLAKLVCSTITSISPTSGNAAIFKTAATTPGDPVKIQDSTSADIFAFKNTGRIYFNGDGYGLDTGGRIYIYVRNGNQAARFDVDGGTGNELFYRTTIGGSHTASNCPLTVQLVTSQVVPAVKVLAADTSTLMKVDESGKVYGTSFQSLANPLRIYDYFSTAQITVDGITVGMGSPTVLRSYTVATLPSASVGVGALAMATDANATTNGTTVVAGGANKVVVKSDGTNWIILG